MRSKDSSGDERRCLLRVLTRVWVGQVRRGSRSKISMSPRSCLYSPTANAKEERRDDGMAVLAHEAHHHVVKTVVIFNSVNSVCLILLLSTRVVLQRVRVL